MNNFKTTLENLTSKMKKPSLSVIAAGLAVGLIGVTATAGVAALATRHVVGSNIGNQCKVASDAYVQLANDQEGDLNKAHQIMSQIQQNPFSTFALAGTMTTLASEVKDRWEDLNEAESCLLYTSDAADD